eukprot:GHVS01104386.1.p1 GENE.GHVS01104386.1~~GHVS01104386.1.p1  ORF type:complete len:377 (+),score=44.13 GHVS01104386.1:167-1132(+)
MSVSYGHGAVDGYLCYDTVQLAGLTIKQQPFILVYRQSGLAGAAFDGVIGLGPPTGANSTLLSQLTTDGIFSVYLSAGPSSDSLVAFGAPDDRLYHDSSLWWAEAALSNWWTIRAHGIAFERGGGFMAEKVDLVLDTGTSYLCVPSAQFETFLTHLLPDDMWHTHCSFDVSSRVSLCDYHQVINHMRPVSFLVGHHRLTLLPEDLLQAPTPYTSSSVLAVVSGSNSLPWILGDVFFRTSFTIFDATNRRIGFARKKHDPWMATSLLATDAPTNPLPWDELSFVLYACGLVVIMYPFTWVMALLSLMKPMLLFPLPYLLCLL